MPRPIHFEIHAGDPQRAIAFYEAVFGWSFQKWGDFPYWLVKTGEGEPGIDGGLVQRQGPNPDPAEPLPVIGCVFTVAVDEVDPFVERALAAGGSVALPKMAIKGVGWLAYCKDTEANIFGLMDEDPNAA
ncbi:VOC family protein [Brevundimonas sp. 2R-24]|uniref:VOC family protein n=1 Tax=Peiella sedimenti TaxID=3061083 RepID=A0ABT8SHX7_9CAUL|nr:VOC family protein [Caulobacteraceae bacterium XZ-24]